MIKNTTLLFFILLLMASANAQYLSLQKNEISKLSAVIESDKSAKKIYLQFEATANAALLLEPNPIDTIISEGHLSTDPKKIRTNQSLADMTKIYALAITYIITKKEAYKKKCIEYITAWATINHGTGNPINDTKLDPIMEAYDLLHNEVSPSTQKTVDSWLMEIADAEISNPRFKTASKTGINNWNSHRIKVVGNIAYLLNNKAYQSFTDTSLKKQILVNLYQDGSGMDLEERDAMHYHIYTLEPLLKIATTIKRATGTDFFTYVSPSGSSIKKSTAFLIPFVNGDSVHHEYVNSKVAFDKKRADNKEPGFVIGAAFQPHAAIEVLSFAAYFDTVYPAIVKKLMNTENVYPNWQSVLNKVRN